MRKYPVQLMFVLALAFAMGALLLACEDSDDDDDDDSTPIGDDDDTAEPNIPQPLTIVHEFPAVAERGGYYEHQFKVKGGTQPYRDWAVVNGNIPPELGLNPSTGLLSGDVLDEEQLYYFVIQVSDSAEPPATASEEFGVLVGEPGADGPLLRRARAYQEVYLARHNMDGLSVDAQFPDNQEGKYGFTTLGDACFVHGNASAGAAYRYAVEQTPEALENVKLHVRGLDLLNRVNGVPGLYSRSYAPPDAPLAFWEYTNLWPEGDDHLVTEGEFEGYHWKGDVSVDQYSGALMGLSLTYDLVDDEEVREVVRRNAVEVADYLIQGDLIIYDWDGEPTKYGDFRGEYLEYVPFPNGLSAAASLAWMKLAYHVSGEQRFQDYYEWLVYGRNYPEIITKFLLLYIGPYTKHYNVYMGFENMFTLIRLEDDPTLKEIYREAFRNMLWESPQSPDLAWRRADVEANPTYTSWYLHAMDLQNPEAVMKSIWQMEVFRDPPLRDRAIYNSDNPNIVKNPQDPTQALYPLPSNLRKEDMCIWHRTPYDLDGGNDNGRERTGHDYMLPYWMLRYYGYIGPEW